MCTRKARVLCCPQRAADARVPGAPPARKTHPVLSGKIIGAIGGQGTELHAGKDASACGRHDQRAWRRRGGLRQQLAGRKRQAGEEKGEQRGHLPWSWKATRGEGAGGFSVR